MRQLQGVQSKYKAATRAQGRYKAAMKGTRHVQGMQGGYESATMGVR